MMESSRSSSLSSAHPCSKVPPPPQTTFFRVHLDIVAGMNVNSFVFSGAALSAVIDFFKALASSGVRGTSCSDLLCVRPFPSYAKQQRFRSYMCVSFDLLQLLTDPIYSPTSVQTSSGLAVHKQVLLHRTIAF